MTDYKYIKHLASLRATSIHPGGAKATWLLIDSLNLNDSQRVLEIGCGTGETMVIIASLYNVYIEGIEILPEMLEASKARIKFTSTSDRIHIQNTNTNSTIPFQDNSFDRVYTESALCFHDLQTAKYTLREIHRVLKDGGLYAAIEAIWKNNISHGKIREVNEKAERDFGLTPSSKDALFLNDWLNIFKESGFEIISYAEMETGIENNTTPVILNNKIILSKIFSFFSKTKIIFTPSLLREFIHFRNIMTSHGQDVSILEGRLFVLKKI